MSKVVRKTMACLSHHLPNYSQQRGAVNQSAWKMTFTSTINGNQWGYSDIEPTPREGACSQSGKKKHAKTSSEINSHYDSPQLGSQGVCPEEQNCWRWRLQMQQIGTACNSPYWSCIMQVMSCAKMKKQSGLSVIIYVYKSWGRKKERIIATEQREKPYLDRHKLICTLLKRWNAERSLGRVKEEHKTPLPIKHKSTSCLYRLSSPLLISNQLAIG